MSLALPSVALLAAERLRAGRKLLICGTGGGAADAQHCTVELVSRFHYDRPRDVLFAPSTPGNSRNILKVLAAAQAGGLTSVGFTGAGGGVTAGLSDRCIRVPSDSTPRIQEGHEVLGDAICALVEATLFLRPGQARDRAGP